MVSSDRVCEFCGSSATPTWRRGPSGKGSLCNACGIKWRLKGKDGSAPIPKKPKVPQQPKQPKQPKLPKQQQPMQPPLSHIPMPTAFHHQQLSNNHNGSSSSSSNLLSKIKSNPIKSNSNFSQPIMMFPTSNAMSSTFNSHNNNPLAMMSANKTSHHPMSLPFSMHPQPFNDLANSNSNSSSSSSSSSLYDDFMYRKKRPISPFEGGYIDDEKGGYFCKYCQKTWPLSSFKNSQQFGAHCSNCSRKPKNEYESSYIHFNKNRNEGLYDDNDEGIDGEDGTVPSMWSDTSNTSFRKNPSNNPLLNRLIHIVENQLIEPKELSMIKDEVETMKLDLISRKKRRIDHLNHGRKLINTELLEMRGGVEESIKNQNDRKKEYIDKFKSHIEQQTRSKEHLFDGDSLAHTVPIPQSPSLRMREPLSPELINSPPAFSFTTNKNAPKIVATMGFKDSKSTIYRDEQGKTFKLDSIDK